MWGVRSRKVTQKTKEAEPDFGTASSQLSFSFNWGFRSLIFPIRFVHPDGS